MGSTEENCCKEHGTLVGDVDKLNGYRLVGVWAKRNAKNDLLGA